jgi:membrane-bound lytic murein transglycosylase D
MSELVALNGLKSRNRIRIGQKIRLPSDSAKPTQAVAYKPKTSATKAAEPAELPASGYYTVRRGDNLTRIAERFGLSVAELTALNDLRSKNRIAVGQKLRVSKAAGEVAKNTKTEPAAQHPDAVASLSPARAADPEPGPGDHASTDAEPALGVDALDAAEADAVSDESAIEPSPGLLADPSDYTVASDGTTLVQANETLGHYAEWLGLRASRLRQINGLPYGQPVAIHQRLRLDFSETRPEDFERVRIEYHRALQEEFFAEWEIEGTKVHRVGPGDSLWVLSTRRLKVPIWLLRQYNPDVDLEALSTGTPLTVPQLRQRAEESSRVDSPLGRGSAAG